MIKKNILYTCMILPKWKKILVTFKKNDVLEISEKIRQMVSIDIRDLRGLTILRPYLGSHISEISWLYLLIFLQNTILQ